MTVKELKERLAICKGTENVRIIYGAGGEMDKVCSLAFLEQTDDNLYLQFKATVREV